MKEILFTLRRTAADEGFQGSDADRDKAIDIFLEELQVALTPEGIKALDPKTLSMVFQDWGRRCRRLSREQRLQAILEAVRMDPVPFIIFESKKEKTPVRPTVERPTLRIVK